MSCSIGLECLAERCPNRRYCDDMAAPWPIPYQIWEIDYWYDLGALIVSIPTPTNWDEVPNNEWDIQSAEEYDQWINYIRRELKEAGWANPVDLPYYWDEVERSLIVTGVHILEAEHCKDPEEGFAPAVQLDNWRSNWLGQRQELRQHLPPPEVDRWGFYLPNGVPGLAWRWQENEDED